MKILITWVIMKITNTHVESLVNATFTLVVEKFVFEIRSTKTIRTK